MKRKKIFLVVSVIFLVGIIGAVTLHYTNLFNFNFRNAVDSDDQTYGLVDEAMMQVDTSRSFVFIGDEGYLVKGELLDQKFAAIYNKLPDTLYALDFEDILFATRHTEVDSKRTYSLVEQNTEKQLNDYNGPWEQDQLLNYLKLAVKGAASYPKFVAPVDLRECLIRQHEFHDIFGNYFNAAQDNNGMSSLPYNVKKLLVCFFESEDGKKYRYKIKGNQSIADLIWRGGLTGTDENEIAILLGNTEDKLDERYMLLVFAIKGFENTISKQYYLVYHEIFYERVLMGHLKYSEDGEEYSKDVYKNTEEPIPTPYDGIVLKQINEVDCVLLYDQNFDKMIKYIQQPKQTYEYSNREDEE